MFDLFSRSPSLNICPIFSPEIPSIFSSKVMGMSPLLEIVSAPSTPVPYTAFLNLT